MPKKKDTGLLQDEPLIFEQGGKGRKGYSLPRWDVEKVKSITSSLPISYERNWKGFLN
jgi:hypothetical protein